MWAWRGAAAGEARCPELSLWGAVFRPRSRHQPPPLAVLCAPAARTLPWTLTSFVLAFTPFPVHRAPLGSLRHFTLKAFEGSCQLEENDFFPFGVVTSSSPNALNE